MFEDWQVSIIASLHRFNDTIAALKMARYYAMINGYELNHNDAREFIQTLGTENIIAYEQARAVYDALLAFQSVTLDARRHYKVITNDFVL